MKMTAKEKAKDLVEWYYDLLPKISNWEDAKLLASKAVWEIIKSEPKRTATDSDWDSEGDFVRDNEYDNESKEGEALTYWQQVDKEIELL